MEVNQLQAIFNAALLEKLECFEGLGQAQTELGAKAGTVAPSAGAASRQLDANADHGTNIELLRVTSDQLQLAELFDHGNDQFAHFASKDGHFDKFVILEAVANDRRFTAIGEG